MRRIWAAGAAVIVALVLSACGSSVKDDPRPKASPVFSASISPAEKFLESVHTSDIYAPDHANGVPTDDELVLFPPKWCATLAEGHSVQWMFDSGPEGLYPAGQNWGTNIIYARQLVVLGVKAFCSQYSDRVTTELRDSGQY